MRVLHRIVLVLILLLSTHVLTAQSSSPNFQIGYAPENTRSIIVRGRSYAANVKINVCVAHSPKSELSASDVCGQRRSLTVKVGPDGAFRSKPFPASNGDIVAIGDKARHPLPDHIEIVSFPQAAATVAENPPTLDSPADMAKNDLSGQPQSQLSAEARRAHVKDAQEYTQLPAPSVSHDGLQVLVHDIPPGSKGKQILLYQAAKGQPCSASSTPIDIDNSIRGNGIVGDESTATLELVHALPGGQNVCAQMTGSSEIFKSLRVDAEPTPNWSTSTCSAGKLDAKGERPDYSLGCPRIWTYQRVYPFMDGIFQDFANTGVSPLTVSSNTANAATLTATQTTVSAGVAFSTVTAAQNQIIQQQNQIAAASAVSQAQLQSQLITQQQALTTQLATATQQAATDNVAFQQYIVQNPTAGQYQLAAAQAVVTNDNAIVTNLSTQLANIKAQISSTSTTLSAGLTSPTLPTPSTASNLPTTFTAPPNAPGTPSFPASKQIDNQINLLWERLSRLVATLAQADSLSSYQLVLAGFNVDLMPLRRKKQDFAVEYTVSGVEKDGSACPATVIDTFPNASATNTVSTRYNDVRSGFSGVLSFFSAGVSASLMRERLQMSQALGQSAYISGFGIGTDTFGWAFGKNLGEDTISPGNRTVFAIIAVPSACNRIHIEAEKAGWFHDDGPIRDFFHFNTPDFWLRNIGSGAYDNHPKPNSDFKYDACVEYSRSSGSEGVDTSKPFQCAVRQTYIENLTYASVDFDSGAPAATPASLQLKLSQPIDPQMTVSVNGHILLRARDSFGRAIAGSGAGGNLETSTFAPNSVNTWIPTSSRELTIQLDPSLVQRRFPDIVMNSPLNSAYLGEALTSMHVSGADPTITVNVGGSAFFCSDPCIGQMPPISFVKSPVKPILAFRRQGSTASNDPDDRLIITVPSDSPTAQQFGSLGSSGLQVVTSPTGSPWGGKPTVTLEYAPASRSDTSTVISLNCKSTDIRLVCSYPALGDVLARERKIDNRNVAVSIQVHDSDHTGGAISGSLLLDASSAPDRPFVVWNLWQPRWFASKPGKEPDTLLLCVSLINSDALATLDLDDATGTANVGHFTKTLDKCSVDATAATVWELQLPIIDGAKDNFNQITDQMTLVGDHSSRPAIILNLRSTVSPVVSTASTDFMRFTGLNLVFPNMSVAGQSFPLSCDLSGASCLLPPKTNLGTTAAPIYFALTDAAHSPILVPVNLVTGGSTTPWLFTPKTDPNKPADGPAKPATASPVSVNLSVSGNGSAQTTSGTATATTNPASGAATPTATTPPVTTAGATPAKPLTIIQ